MKESDVWHRWLIVRGYLWDAFLVGVGVFVLTLLFECVYALWRTIK